MIEGNPGGMDKHPSSTCMCTIWFGDWQKIYMYIHKIMISYDKWLVRGSTQIHPDISGWWMMQCFTGSATDSPSPFTIAWSLPLQLDMAMFPSWRRQGPRAPGPGKPQVGQLEFQVAKASKSSDGLACLILSWNRTLHLSLKFRNKVVIS